LQLLETSSSPNQKTPRIEARKKKRKRTENSWVAGGPDKKTPQGAELLLLKKRESLGIEDENGRSGIR